MGKIESVFMSRMAVRVHVFHNLHEQTSFSKDSFIGNHSSYLMTPLASPPATTLMETPSGAEEKHSEVMTGLVVVVAINVALSDLSSRWEVSALEWTTQAMSARFLLTANWATGG